MATNQSKDETLYETILDTSLRIFAEQGMVETYLRDISKAVGIRESKIYQLFDGKEEILEVLIRRRTQQEALMVGEVFIGISKLQSVGYLNRDIVAGILSANVDRTITDHNFLYERIMDMEKYRNPHVKEVHYKNSHGIGQKTFELIIVAFQKAGLLEETMDASRAAEVSNYIYRASIEKHLMLGMPTEEILAACRRNILENILYLYDTFAARDQVALDDDLIFGLGLRIAKAWPEMMKWVVLRFEAMGLMDRFLEILTDEDVKAAALKKQATLQEMGAADYAATDFDASIHLDGWEDLLHA